MNTGRAVALGGPAPPASSPSSALAFASASDISASCLGFQKPVAAPSLKFNLNHHHLFTGSFPLISDPEELSLTCPITLCDSTIDTVESFRFLGTIISQDLKWELNISSLIKKAQQRMYFLRQLKKFNLPRTLMVHFYSSIIESILTSSVTIWYAAATAKDKGRLQRVIRSAEKVIGCNLLSLQDLYTSRTLRRAGKIVDDPSHPGHKLFETLPSGIEEVCRLDAEAAPSSVIHKRSFADVCERSWLQS
ncbi:hypothetical protein N1851_030920 [Merluccius polli]|uniref:Alkylated DNA repair protein AlkB homologue 8 N-terminal domain-containing protein n=1 Tax=Merluccius polli TaxID=89951 RepID=A0AA47NQF0_MERPO|nr:hypothetical protein N1851_030920 [Merluccius polli]